MNPENEIDKTEALEPVETAAANVAEARGGVDGRKRPKWLLPLIAMDFAKESHVPVNLCPRIPVYPYCREILPDFL